MPDRESGLPMLRPITDLKLTADQRDALEERVAAITAVNVYRQLREVERLAVERGDSGCNIITNCSSSSKIAELAEM
jgi:hypothetical protein